MDNPEHMFLAVPFVCSAAAPNICSWKFFFLLRPNPELMFLVAPPSSRGTQPSSRTQLTQLIRSFFQLAAVCQIFDGGETSAMREAVVSRMFASLQHFKVLTLQHFKAWTMRGGHNLFIKHLFIPYMAGRTFVHTIYRLIMNSVLTGCMVSPCGEFING